MPNQTIRTMLPADPAPLATPPAAPAEAVDPLAAVLPDWDLVPATKFLRRR